jgi:hypothetical protein
MDFLEATGLCNEPGWHGSFTRRNALGAWRAGTRIVKVKSEEGDATPDGAQGVVLGSISHKDLQNGMPLYFVEWDSQPRCAVACIGWKLGAVAQATTKD